MLCGRRVSRKPHASIFDGRGRSRKETGKAAKCGFYSMFIWMPSPAYNMRRQAPPGMRSLKSAHFAVFKKYSEIQLPPARPDWHSITVYDCEVAEARVQSLVLWEPGARFAGCFKRGDQLRDRSPLAVIPDLVGRCRPEIMELVP